MDENCYNLPTGKVSERTSQQWDHFETLVRELSDLALEKSKALSEDYSIFSQTHGLQALLRELQLEQELR